MNKLTLAIICLMLAARSAQAQSWNPQIPIEAAPMIDALMPPLPPIPDPYSPPSEPEPLPPVCMPDVNGNMVCR